MMQSGLAAVSMGPGSGGVMDFLGSRGPGSGGVMDLREDAPAPPAAAAALEGSKPDAKKAKAEAALDGSKPDSIENRAKADGASNVKQAKGERKDKERKAKAASPRKEDKMKA